MKNKKFSVLALAAIAAVMLCGAGYKALSVPNVESAQDAVFSGLDKLERMGAYLETKDGQKIGTISRRAPNGIANDYGSAGQYNKNGALNEYGTKTGRYARNSALNAYSTDPPRIMVDEGNKTYEIGLLTNNKYAQTRGQRISPDFVKLWAATR